MNLLSGTPNRALLSGSLGIDTNLSKSFCCFISKPLFTFHSVEIKPHFLKSTEDAVVYCRAGRPSGAPMWLPVVCYDLVKRVRKRSKVETRLITESLVQNHKQCL